FVYEAQQRPLFCRLSQEAQDGQGDEKAVVSSSRCQAPRSPERIRLRPRHLLELLQDRAQELLQGRERERRLRLDSGASKDLHPRGLLARVLQQRRLAAPPPPGDDEDAPSRRARALEEPPDDRALLTPALQQQLDRSPPPPLEWP